ncbi:CvfB family protein [Pseudoalteromonas sp. T1lg65]|uniref:CvfB family protein n=1 Tax=Pseudoalteromonas sp. T1lg65 TaxID=2077101 RepID=UPI003F7926F3
MLGQIKMLTIEELTAEGAYLNGGDLGEVFLPNEQIPDYLEEGDSVEVFIFLDNQGHPTATTKKPLAQVGDFALLRVKEINNVGAFLDLGIEKDVLAPFNEQKPKMRDGYSYLVKLYLDKASQRICASSALRKFLNKTKPSYEKFEEVDLIVAAKTDLGFKVIVNEAHYGLVFSNDVFKKMYIGQRMKGYVKAIRDEDKIDIVLEKPGIGKVRDLSEHILAQLKENGGHLPLGDKSDPEAIKRAFSTSKANYKKAIGGLFKQGLIDIEATAIKLRK